MSDYLVQGKLKFAAGYKLQRRWGITEACVFTLECIGAPLVAMSLLMPAALASFVAGLLMVMLAIALLLFHLGHPRRAWKAMLNVRHSWISRGTLALGAFVALGVLCLVVRLWSGPEQAPAVNAAIRWVFVAGAVFIGLYPGLVLSASPAIPFWNTGLLPVLSLLQGTASAAVVLVAIEGGNAMLGGQELAGMALWLLAAVALVLAVYVAGMLRRGAAGAESARHLMRDHSWLFFGAAWGLGIVLPFVLMAGFASGDGSAFALAAAAIARMAGDFALRHAFLKVGMFDPVV